MENATNAEQILFKLNVRLMTALRMTSALAARLTATKAEGIDITKLHAIDLAQTDIRVTNPTLCWALASDGSDSTRQSQWQALCP